MNFSYSLENALMNLFVEGENRWYGKMPEAPSYENNGVFSKFLEVVLPYDGECFIPVMGLSDTIQFLQEWFDKVSPTQPVKISYPLYVGGRDTKRTADAILQSIRDCPQRYRLANIKTSKGLDYYGGQGIIFDEHWTPLMLCGFIVNIDRLNRVVRFVKPVCYVSPAVFENNDIISKAIAKKVILYMSTSSVNIPPVARDSSNTTYDSSNFRNVPVTINYIDKYFSAPKKPGSDTMILDDALWEFLGEYVSDLI